MTENLLIIFAKYPESGRVKTRLAAELGDTEALRIYRACSQLVISSADPDGTKEYRMAIACWPPEKIDAMEQWLGPNIKIFGQQGHDLGSRMHHAFTDGFAAGYKKIIIIGADCPAVTHELIMRAFAGLDSAAVVIGPATDGGYYLIGLRHPIATLFEGISWGSDRVCEQTLSHCLALNIPCALLPELRDIDRSEDLEYYRQKGLVL